jgi:3-oxoacyl-[acyl-carrier protein] reductase
MARLRGAVVLVTGASSGIGEATALAFAREGGRLVLCARRFDRLQAVAQRCRAAGAAEVVVRKADVSRPAEARGFVAIALSSFERIDVLVNNAGVTRDAQFVKMQDGVVVKQMSEPDFDLVIDINLKGVFNCAQAVVPFMVKQGGGVILNASSAVALYGNFGQSNYVATKTGVIGMTKVWARELGRSNIRVNAVAPGFTATEMVMKMPEKVREGMKARTPLGCLAEPSDIANAYFFLASDQARLITGTVLSVDGGLVIGT